MGDVTFESHDTVSLLRLTRGVTNALDLDLIDELDRSLETVRTESRAMVLAGGEKFFCIGLDLPVLLKLGRADMAHFWDRVNKVILDLFTLPIPTACAIRGHATAGGTILALTADYRLIASGRKLMGLNEVKIGLPVPYLADLMLRQIVSDRAATEIVYTGEFLTPDRGESIGLVDEVLPVVEVEPRAIAKLAALAERSPEALAAIKATRVEDVRKRYDQNSAAKTQEILDMWFSEPTQRLLSEAAEKF